MARACAICGKTSIGGINPQSVGMNRVRAHRRFEPNLQYMRLERRRRPHRVLVCTRCRRTLQRTYLRPPRSSQMVIGPSLTSSTSISAPKMPARDPHAARLHGRREPLVEPLAQLGRRSIEERRPPALARVREQRELAHRQHLAADVDQ